MSRNILNGGLDGADRARSRLLMATIAEVRPDVLLVQKASACEADGMRQPFDIERDVRMRGLFAIAPRTGQNTAVFLEPGESPSLPGHGIACAHRRVVRGDPGRKDRLRLRPLPDRRRLRSRSLTRAVISDPSDAEPREAARLLERGLRLEYATLAWNVVGTVVVTMQAVRAGSAALAGFGFDSLIEIFASVIVVWQLRGVHRRREGAALRMIAIAFLLLSVYVLFQSA